MNFQGIANELERKKYIKSKSYKNGANDCTCVIKVKVQSIVFVLTKLRLQFFIQISVLRKNISEVDFYIWPKNTNN